MKLKHHAIKGFFLSFSLELYCYIVIDYKNLSIHLVRKVVFYEFTPGKLTLTDSNNKNKFNRILPKYFNLENYSIHISNENTTSSTNSVNNQQKDTNQTEDKTGNTNLSHNQQIDDNQIKNIKLNSSYENNSSFIKNNYDKVANNSNMEEIIFTDEPNINNESQNFELISNHSTENIIDKVNTNDKTENIFDEFRDNINESYYSIPNFEAINDDNIFTTKKIRKSFTRQRSQKDSTQM